MKKSTTRIIMAWAGLEKEPAKNRNLKALWAASGTPTASDWDKGAASLAKKLLPQLRGGQSVNKESIQSLQPMNVGTLAGSLAMGSRQIVMAWANLTKLPVNAADLKTLWAASGEPLAGNWNAGATQLASDLHPDLRPGQVVDRAFIQNLNPSTVGQLEATLGW